jgi:RNA polymerase sigma factor (sigma-70 family)
VAQSRRDCRNLEVALVRTVWSMGPRAHLDRLGDDALLAALALDEPDAAVVFVRRFQRRVYGLALAVTGDAGVAEDVAQQAFERAWRHAGSFDARRGSVTTWLLTITRNLAIDALRLRRPVPVDGAVLDDLLPAASADVEGDAVSGDQLRRVRAELSALPVEQRRAVVLATVLGRTSAEIAALESVPVGTAKTRLRTGLRRLRARLDVEAPS